MRRGNRKTEKRPADITFAGVSLLQEIEALLALHDKVGVVLIPCLEAEVTRRNERRPVQAEGGDD